MPDIFPACDQISSIRPQVEVITVSPVVTDTAANFRGGYGKMRMTMDANTAVSIMKSLDQAEDLLRRMRLRDGYTGNDMRARNRELLDAARRRLEQIHSIAGMDILDSGPGCRLPLPA